MTTNLKPAADIVIREIGDPAEMRAVEELQKEVWGGPELDVVPLTQLVGTRAAGGVLLGAFDAGSMVGFAYGFPGFEHGIVSHHSHMLAVRPEYRNHNLGYRLKLAQREFVLKQGISEMTWTFDPLQSLNAHFNFERLGVLSNKYYIDFYGKDPSSFLHQTGTDRLWVTWRLESERVRDRISGGTRTAKVEDVFNVVEHGRSGEPIVRDELMETSGSRIGIEIPSSIGSVERDDRELAAGWREATRQAFTALFGAGFSVVGFVRGEACGTYILEKNT